MLYIYSIKFLKNYDNINYIKCLAEVEENITSYVTRVEQVVKIFPKVKQQFQLKYILESQIFDWKLLSIYF